MKPVTRSEVDFSTKPCPQAAQPRRRFTLRLLLVLIDLLLLLGIYLGSLAIRYPSTFSNYLFWDVIIILIMTTLVPLGLIGGHSKTTDLQSLRFMSEHVIVSAFTFLLATFCIYVVSAFNVMMSPARLNVSVTLILFPLVSLLYRRRMAVRMNLTQKFKSIYIPALLPKTSTDYSNKIIGSIHYAFFHWTLIALITLFPMIESPIWRRLVCWMLKVRKRINYSAC